MPLVSVSGHSLYYELHAARDPDPSLPPLVLVTGIGGRCAGWLLYQVPAFCERRPVLIYDHRGVGGSENFGGSYTTRDLADDLLALLDALDLGTVDAAGYFIGAMVLQEAALAAPGRFRRLAMIGSWARVDARRSMLLREWSSLARRDIPAASMVRQRLVWTFSGRALEETALIESAIDRLDDGQTPLTGEAFARQVDACLEHDTLDRLSALEHPSLVLCGRQDLLTPPKFGREIAQKMPNARDIALAYGGHAIMLERPERFNQVVGHFFEEPDAET